MNFIPLFLNACRMEEICMGIILSTPVWRTTANLMEFFSWTVTQWVSVRSIIKLFWIFRDEWTLRAESNDYKKGCYLKQNFDLLRNRHQRMLNKLNQNDILFLRRKYTIALFGVTQIHYYWICSSPIPFFSFFVLRTLLFVNWIDPWLVQILTVQKLRTYESKAVRRLPHRL